MGGGCGQAVERAEGEAVVAGAADQVGAPAGGTRREQIAVGVVALVVTRIAEHIQHCHHRSVDECFIRFRPTTDGRQLSFLTGCSPVVVIDRCPRTVKTDCQRSTPRKPISIPPAIAGDG